MSTNFLWLLSSSSSSSSSSLSAITTTVNNNKKSNNNNKRNNNSNSNMTKREDINHIGLALLGYTKINMIATKVVNRKFVEAFGLPTRLIYLIWRKCIFPPKTKPKHLFWALFFLRHYPTANELGQTFKTCPKTMKKWVWPVLRGIAALYGEMVSSSDWRKSVM